MTDPQSHGGADLFRRHMALDRKSKGRLTNGPSLFAVQ
jgi:hypothetical protein